MLWYRTLLAIILLMVCQVISIDPSIKRGHAPAAVPGSMSQGAFGGAPSRGQVMWITAGPDNQTTTVEATTVEIFTEKPSTEAVTTEVPTTEVPSTKEPSTEEPSTEEPSTEEPSTEEPSTEDPTTEDPTTEDPTTEVPSTEEPSTEEPSTEDPTTEDPTTEDPTTEDPTTEVPSTEEPSTEEPSTEEPTTEEASTEEPSTENPTSEDPTTEIPSGETVTPGMNARGGKGNAMARFNRILPDGTLIEDLGKDFKAFEGKDDNWSRIVANEESIYVLHPVQGKSDAIIYNPYTIGQVLGYIFEKSEFGSRKPPGGKYTIELMGGRIPVKRGVLPGKTRRATLVFTKKNNI